MGQDSRDARPERSAGDAFAADASADAGRAFVDVVVRYIDEARAGRGPVSSPLAPRALAARFDEPLPAHGAPLAEVLARVQRDVLSDCNRLYHPMYMGHQVSAPLPAAVWTELAAQFGL